MALVLVVDDDIAVRDVVVDAVTLAGHQALSAEDGYSALSAIRAENVDLVVTDVNMPRMDGFELLSRIRGQGSDIPVLLLTARDQKLDISTGFRAGADDYVSKPFGLEELTLRIQALLRRAGKLSEEVELLTCGPLTLDRANYKVTKSVIGEIELSPTEFRLLTELMLNKGRVLAKNVLLDKIWGFGYQTGATVLDTYISYLRRKVHDENWQGIKTVRGIGFKLVEDEAT